MTKSENIKRIPLSCNNFYIKIDGTVLTKDNELVDIVKDNNGESRVLLQLWDGFTYYKVGVLVCLSFKRTNLPYYYWKFLDIMYVDGDTNNLHPDNLIWKYPEKGLLSLKYGGFAYIPNYTRYLINKNAVLISDLTGKLIKPFIDKMYAKFKIVSDDRGLTSIGRHRLLALAWLEYPSNVDELVINHIDGIPGHDVIDNVEWVTRSQNNTHASKLGLLKPDNSILVKNCKTGEITEYKGYIDCARKLNLHRDTVKYRVLKKPQRMYHGYLLFKLKNDNEPWNDSLLLKDRPLNKGLNEPVKIRNPLTNEEFQFDSIPKLAFHINGTPSGIRSFLKRNDKLETYLGFNIKYSKDDSEWVDYTEEQLRIYSQKRNNRSIAIKVIDLLSDESKVFTDITSCSESFNLTKGFIASLIMKKRLYINRFRFIRIT